MTMAKFQSSMMGHAALYEEGMTAGGGVLAILGVSHKVQRGPHKGARIRAVVPRDGRG